MLYWQGASARMWNWLKRPDREATSYGSRFRNWRFLENSRREILGTFKSCRVAEIWPICTDVSKEPTASSISVYPDNGSRRLPLNVIIHVHLPQCAASHSIKVILWFESGNEQTTGTKSVKFGTDRSRTHRCIISETYGANVISVHRFCTTVVTTECTKVTIIRTNNKSTKWQSKLC
jgi:hypothetical protein